MERQPLSEAIYDDPRPGRPSNLTAEQRADLAAALEEAPNEYGLEASTWTPDLAQTYIEQKFDIEYTRRHVQRLLNDLESS